MDAPLIIHSFRPWSDSPRPCWHCSAFRALVHQGSAALCTRGSGPVIRSLPQQGCSAFEREPGVDDEPGWHPTALPPEQSAPLIAAEVRARARTSAAAHR